MSKLSLIFLSLASVSSLIIDSFHNSLSNCLVHFNISESSPFLFLPSPFLFLFPPSPCQSFSLCSRCWVIFFCSYCHLLVEFHASSSSVLFPSPPIFQTGLGMRLLPFTLWSMFSVGSLLFAILTQMFPPFSFSAVVPVHGNGAWEVWVYFIPELEIYLLACCCLKLSIQWKSLQQQFC